MTNVNLRTALGDRYTIEGELGSGGMAIVYRALDRKHDRPVAIKVMRPEVAAAMGRERFLSEISIAAKLQHPHILALIDSGDAEGVLFYVMPFLEGETLAQRIARESQLPASDAMQITSEAAEQRKPANFEAYDTYLRGIHSFDKRTETGNERAIELLERATKEDPTFAPAFAALAKAYVEKLFTYDPQE